MCYRIVKLLSSFSRIWEASQIWRGIINPVGQRLSSKTCCKFWCLGYWYLSAGENLCQHQRPPFPSPLFFWRISIFQWVIEAITIPVKPLLTPVLRFFNDQVPDLFQRTWLTLKIYIFIFQLKTVQLKEKITSISNLGLWSCPGKVWLRVSIWFSI